MDKHHIKYNITLERRYFHSSLPLSWRRSQINFPPNALQKGKFCGSNEGRKVRRTTTHRKNVTQTMLLRDWDTAFWDYIVRVCIPAKCAAVCRQTAHCHHFYEAVCVSNLRAKLTSFKRITSGSQLPQEFLYNWQLRSEVDEYHSVALRISALTVVWHAKVFPRTCTAEQRQPHSGKERTDRATASLVEESGRRRAGKLEISAFRVASCVVTPLCVNSNKILQSFDNYLQSTWRTHPIRIFINTSMRTSNFALYIYREDWNGRDMWHVGRKGEVCTRFWWGNLREGDHWGDQDVDGRIILRWIFRKWEGVVGSAWSWLRIGTGGGRLWVRYWALGFHKMRGISWLPAKPVTFSRRTLLHGVSK